MADDVHCGNRAVALKAAEQLTRLTCRQPQLNAAPVTLKIFRSVITQRQRVCLFGGRCSLRQSGGRFKSGGTVDASDVSTTAVKRRARDVKNFSVGHHSTATSLFIWRTMFTAASGREIFFAQRFISARRSGVFNSCATSAEIFLSPTSIAAP